MDTRSNRAQSQVKFEDLPQKHEASSDSGQSENSGKEKQKSAQSAAEIDRLFQMSREAEASKKKSSLKSILFHLKSKRLHRRCRAGYSEHNSKQDMAQMMKMIKRQNM